MAIDQLTLCNGALSKLGVSPMRNLSEDGTAARAVKARFDDIFEEALRSHTWNCAKAYTTLAPDTDTPAFQYQYQMTIPPDYMRLVWLGDTPDTTVNDPPEYDLTGTKLLTDSSVIYMVYVKRLTDYSKVDPLLRSAFEYMLAADICIQVTNDPNKQKYLENKVQERMRFAKSVNASELQNKEVDVDEWIRSRQGAARADRSNR